MKIKTLIIIPARSGSKGIADKNIRILNGRPLLCWTAAAIKLAAIKNSLAIVSTDSLKYQAIAKECGLEVPFIRPQQYSTHTTSAIDTIKHCLEWFEHKYQYLPEQTMWLQPTSPFRSPEVIQQAIELMEKGTADSVIGCKAINRDLTTLFNQENNFISPLSTQQKQQTRRQDITPLLTPNGAMYLIKTQLLLSNESFYPERTIPLCMNNIMSHDIDIEEDWQIAQAYIKQKLDWLGQSNHE